MDGILKAALISSRWFIELNDWLGHRAKRFELRLNSTREASQGSSPCGSLCEGRRAQRTAGEIAIILLAGTGGFRRMRQPERNSRSVEPRLQEKRARPVSEQALERGRKFRRMARGHFQNGSAR